MPAVTLTNDICLNKTTELIELIDLTTYVAQGVALADVNGNLKVTNPSAQVVYNNTDFTDANCDVDVEVSTTNQTSITLPLLANGEIEPGTWTFLYTVQNSNTSEVYTLTKTVNIQHVSPSVTMSVVVNCASPLITSTDTTNYTVNLITPTIVRVHEIVAPAASGLADVVGSGPVLTTITFFTGENKQRVTSTLDYDLGDTICIKDEVSGGNDFDVACDDNLCELACCIESLSNQYLNALENNQTLAKTLQPQLTIAASYLIMAQQAFDCGRNDQFNTLADKIRDITNCSKDCTCDDGIPALVTGSSGTSITVVDAGSGIAVATAINGSTTTYTVSMDATLLTKLNGLANDYIVASGTDITVTSATVSGVITYTVNFTGTIPAISEKVSSLATLTYSNFVAPVVAIAMTNQDSTGSNIQDMTVADIDNGNPNFKNLNNRFLVNGFQGTPSTAFKVRLDMMLSTVSDPNTGNVIATGSAIDQIDQGVDIQMYNKVSGAFSFRFVAADTGIPLTNQQMVEFTEILVNIYIDEA